MAFNIDPVPWKTFTNNTNTGFGYKVIQKGASLLVSDPLIQLSQTQRGQIYDCSVTRGNCMPMAITNYLFIFFFLYDALKYVKYNSFIFCNNKYFLFLFNKVPAEAVNMSLGLSMTLDPQSSNAVVSYGTFLKCNNIKNL
ncbi:Integrin alpha-M [Labeo rohita]|uniref:Integrin alpha-M n=1 Tax=Labeo rohita TaxID=84645 RepID=A0ABQ8L0I7_LABRO|nr:Integrin alpha-M [Labeo rohita]